MPRRSITIPEGFRQGGRQKKDRVFRYFSLVLPMRELLPPDGLLSIQRHRMQTPRGHASLGYVIYDHLLPAMQRKAYRLEFDGKVPRADSYPPFPSYVPREMRETLLILHPELSPEPAKKKSKKRKED